MHVMIIGLTMLVLAKVCLYACNDDRTDYTSPDKCIYDVLRLTKLVPTNVNTGQLGPDICVSVVSVERGQQRGWHGHVRLGNVHPRRGHIAKRGVLGWNRRGERGNRGHRGELHALIT